MPRPRCCRRIDRARRAPATLAALAVWALAGWALTAWAPAQPPSRTLPPAPAPTPAPTPTLEVNEPALEVREPDGGRLLVRDAAVVRQRAGVETVLRCTREGGTGDVRAIVIDAVGTAFVAAANGVFMTRPEVDTLDPIEARDGVPRGAAVGLAIDAQRRLWVATTESFGCIDTVHFFGRTLDADDGLPLPAPPYTGLHAEPDGTLVLRAAAGELRHVPGVRRPSLEATAPEPDIADGEDLVLQLRSDAAGGASYRYRLLDRHQLLPVAGPPWTVRGLRPGCRGIAVTAYDRDLCASEPVTVPLSVRGAKHFDPRIGLAGAALVLVLAVAAFRRRRRWSRALLCAALLLLVLGQIAAGVLRTGRSWPFIGFSMYTETYRENDLIYKHGLYAIGADGGGFPFDPFHVGRHYDWIWQVLLPLLYGPHAHEHREQLAREVLAHWAHLPLCGFDVRHDRWRLTANGPQRVAAIVHVRQVGR